MYSFTIIISLNLDMIVVGYLYIDGPCLLKSDEVGRLALMVI